MNGMLTFEDPEEQIRDATIDAREPHEEQGRLQPRGYAAAESPSAGAHPVPASAETHTDDQEHRHVTRDGQRPQGDAVHEVRDCRGVKLDAAEVHAVRTFVDRVIRVCRSARATRLCARPTRTIASRRGHPASPDSEPRIWSDGMVQMVPGGP